MNDIGDRESGFGDLLAEAEKNAAFWEEQAIISFTEDVCAAMERTGVSKAELARRLGVSPAYVTKVLRGNANLTLRSMTRLSLALDSELQTRLAPSPETTKARLPRPIPGGPTPQLMPEIRQNAAASGSKTYSDLIFRRYGLEPSAPCSGGASKAK